MEKSSRNEDNLLLWGNTYNRLEDVSDQFDLPLTSFIIKYRECKDLESCVIYFLNRLIEYDGRKYKSFLDVGKLNGVSPESIYNRLKLGWKIEDAVSREVRNINDEHTKIVHNGTSYNSKRSLCQAFGISSTLVYSTMKYHNITDWFTCFDLIVNFLTECEGNRPKIVSKIPYVIYNNVWCNTAKEFCDQCKIPYSSFCGGVSNASDNFEPLKLMEKMGKSICLKKRYPRFSFNINEFCKNSKRDFQFLLRKENLNRRVYLHDE